MNTENNNKIYEVGYLLLPTLAEEKLTDEVAFIKSLIEKHGGAFISEGFPERRHLAYEMSKEIDIKKHRFNEGYFGWVKFEVGNESIAEIKKALDAHVNILRYLLINTVRENTLYVPKVSPVEVAGAEGDVDADKPVATAEEIDKSIEALVV